MWNARLPGIGLKPALLISRRVVTINLRPIVARISSVPRERAIPTAVGFAPGEVAGLSQPSWALCHDMFTLLSPDALVERLGQIAPLSLYEVEEALGYTLGLAG